MIWIKDRRKNVGNRDSLMAALESGSKWLHFPGAIRRLPNTLSILTPGWRGDLQVMQMDLAGFAVSGGFGLFLRQGRPSSVLTAMGIAPERAGDAIRVSIGPTTDRRDVMRLQMPGWRPGPLAATE